MLLRPRLWSGRRGQGTGCAARWVSATDVILVPQPRPGGCGQGDVAGAEAARRPPMHVATVRPGGGGCQWRGTPARSVGIEVGASRHQPRAGGAQWRHGWRGYSTGLKTADGVVWASLRVLGAAPAVGGGHSGRALCGQTLLTKAVHEKGFATETAAAVGLAKPVKVY